MYSLKDLIEKEDSILRELKEIKDRIRKKNLEVGLLSLSLEDLLNEHTEILKVIKHYRGDYGK